MSLPWFPCYPSNLLGSFRWRSMTNEERGAYWQLLCLCYQSANGKLPAEVQTLSRLAELDLTKHPLILEAFPEDGEGNRYNERAYSEWVKRQQVSEKRAEAGAAGAAKRWQTDGKDDGKRIANANTSTSTSTSTEKKEQKEESVHSKANERALNLQLKREFNEQFWPEYPRKQAKKAAEVAYIRARKRGTSLEQMLDAVRSQKRTAQWQENIIPLAATWCNQDRWEDESSGERIVAGLRVVGERSDDLPF